MSVDLRQKEREELFPTDITKETHTLLASCNNIQRIPFDYFFRAYNLTHIDLSNNKLKDINCLKCFRCLEFLDISSNSLDVNSLFDIRNLIIVSMNLKGNVFDDIRIEFPRFLPALLANCWIIDGIFITDYERALNIKYASSLEFGEIIVTRANNKVGSLGNSSVAQVGRQLIAWHDLAIQDGVEFTPPRVSVAAKVNEQTQYEKLAYLASIDEYEVVDGEFLDYFGVAAAIVSKLWIGESLDTIARFVCRGYWFGVMDDINKMCHYQLMVLLFRIAGRIKFEDRIQIELWNTLNINRFLKSGKIPLLGSTPRLTVAALIARAVAFTDAQPSEMSLDDLKCYFRMRKSFGFTGLDSDLRVVHREMTAVFTTELEPLPETGEEIELIHPLTGDWAKANVIGIRLGRVYAKHNEIVIQVPLGNTYWDGRGFWKEDARPETLKQQSGPKESVKMFITAADMQRQTDQRDAEEILSSFKPPKNSRRSVPPIDRDTIIQATREHAQLRSLTARDSELDESKLMDGWRTFRGIVRPSFQSRSSVPRQSLPTRTQSITGVVNIVPETTLDDGGSSRRFNVRYTNALTGKSKYGWIRERDISPSYANELTTKYVDRVATKSLESKATNTERPRQPLILSWQ